MTARLSQDHIFDVVLDGPPEVLRIGLRSAGLDDPGVLDCYPRDSCVTLVEAGVTGASCTSDTGLDTSGELGTGVTIRLGGGYVVSSFLSVPYQPFLINTFSHNGASDTC